MPYLDRSLQTTALQPIQESAIASWYSGIGEVDSDDWQYRKITEEQTSLPNFIHDHMQKVALYLFQRNPEAQNYVNMMRDFPIGEGMHFVAQDPKVQEVLETFWYDFDNDWERRISYFAQDLCVFGEQCVLFRPEPSGIVHTEYLSPMNIQSVYPSISDKYAVDRIVTRKGTFSNNRNAEEEFKQIHYDPKKKLVIGDMLFLGINKISDASRGMSDLFATADWMDIREQFLYNRARRAAFVNMFLLDVAVKNAHPRKLDELRRYFQRQPTRPGSIIVHGEDVNTTFISPSLGGGDAVDESRLFESYINTGLGVPPHWKGTPVAGGRTTGPEASEPMYKKLATRQNEIASFVRKMFRFQIDYLVSTGKLSPTVSRDVRILLPRVAKRDVMRMGGAFNRFIDGVALGLERAVLSEEQSKELLLEFIAEMGLDIQSLGVSSGMKERLKGKEQPSEL